eukprot:g40011.t1
MKKNFFIQTVVSMWNSLPARVVEANTLCVFKKETNGIKEYGGRPNQSPSTDTLICLAKLVLTLNNFSCNSSHFLQTKGVAIGIHMGPSYACLFVGYVEQSLFHSYTGPKHHLFLRYIDDCIGAASCSHEELEQFIHFTNTFHP